MEAARNRGRMMRSRRRTSPARYLVVLIVPFMIGCTTYSAVRYAPMAETVAILRQHRSTPVNVGAFTMKNPRGASIDCRGAGPVQTPDDEPIEEYVRKALVSELIMAEMYSQTAPVTLTGFLEEFDFSSMKGRWKMTLVVTSSHGRQVTVSEDYDYDFHFIGDVACRQTAHAMTPAVQNLIRTLVQHPGFPALLSPGQ
jgi:hypothetical protein